MTKNFTYYFLIGILVPDVVRYLIPCSNKHQGAITLERTFGEASRGVNIKTITVEIPRFTPLGTYKLGTVVSYNYFGLQWVIRRVESNCFEVVE